MMKLQHNGEIYKVPKCPKSYDELLKITTDKFGDKLPECIEFCYIDADNDTITVSNELDYANALSFMESTKGTSMKFTIRPRAGYTNTAGGTKGEKETDLETTMPVPREHSAKSEAKKDEVDASLAVSKLDETIAMQVPTELPKVTDAGSSIEELSYKESPLASAKGSDKNSSTCLICEKGHCQHLKPLTENDRMYETLGETASFIKGLFEKFMAEREASILQTDKTFQVSAEPQHTEVPQPPKELVQEQPKSKPVNDTLLMDSNIEGMMNASFLRRCRIVESNEKGWTCVFCNKHFPSETVRYCCTVCEQFDLCVACEEKVGENHEHPLLKLRRKLANPLEIEIKSLEIPAYQAPVAKIEKEVAAAVGKVPVVPVEKKPVPKDAKLLASLVSVEPSDKLVCAPGLKLELGIRLRNSSSVDWTPGSFVLQCIDGEYKGVEIPCKRVIAVKEEELFIFEIEAPERLGRFEVSFRMLCTELGKHFGPRAIYSIETNDQMAHADEKKAGAISVRTIERNGGDSNEPIRVPTYDNCVIEKAKQFQAILGGKFEDYCPFLQGYKTENRSIESLMDEYLNKKLPPYPVTRPVQTAYQQAQQFQRFSAVAEEETPY